MEKQPGFVLKLSLEEMALSKSVVNFWIETDILTLIEKFPFKKMFDKGQLWQETVEDKVKDKISKLVFPESLKRRMNHVVKPIGLQIPEWVNFMEQCLCDSRENLDMHFLKQLSWTSAGALDYGRTAEKLVSLQTLEAVKRFKIACGHCLADYLPVVWKELPEGYKNSFEGKFFNPNYTPCILDDKWLLQTYWAFVLKGEEYRLLQSNVNFYFYAFEYSAQEGNKAATEYFFQKLSNEERDYYFASKFQTVFVSNSIHRFVSDFPKEKCTDAYCFLLSQITPKQQMQVLRDYPCWLFENFLHWPWQNLFLEKTDLIWNLIPEGSTYDHLLHDIRLKIQLSDYYFPELFQEFFRRSPKDFRKHFVNQECRLSNNLLHTFLNNEDEESIKAILGNIDAEDRVRLVSSFNVFKCFDSHIGRKCQYLVELCIREAYPSREDRDRLDDVYFGFLTYCIRLEWRELKWERFFKSMDKTDMSGLKKRRSGDETATRFKILY